MRYLKDMFVNPVLVSALVGWAVAQVGKAILYAIINKRFSFERMVGSGGMPSSHAATMCAAATTAAIHFGTASFEFAITFLLMVVVLHDARGVRFETGKQAATLSAIVDFLKEVSAIELPDLKLKELVGHTPLQVLVGAVLGILTGLALG